MGNGISRNCSHQNPCLICGKTDWCNIISFPNGNILAQCQRIHGNKGDVISANGNTWRAQQTKDSGFTVWEPLAQYEANREAFLREKYPNGYIKKKSYVREAAQPEKIAALNDLPVEGVSECLPPEKLDHFYRTLLSILVLEKKHEIKLRQEWDKKAGIFERIVNQYMIRSLPPEDKLRFSSEEKLQNPSRKRIMEQLVSKCGEPKGVPGFYQRNNGTWTMHPLSGIVFPVFDSSNRIIRIRIGTDYPQVKGIFEGKEGYYSYYLKDDVAGWYFRTETDEPVLVWKYGAKDNLIKLNSKGYPDGKISGKYMNFTSYKAIAKNDDDGKLKKVNKYYNGCESSSFCSLYTKEGDDTTFVYVTEGEKKAMVANVCLNVPVISVPGVNSTSKLFDNELGESKSLIDAMKNKGMRGVVLVFDADKATNEAVLFHEHRTIKYFKERNITIAIGEWSIQWGKGLDDVLLEDVYPEVYLID